jgi:hypothetical protein
MANYLQITPAAPGPYVAKNWVAVELIYAQTAA